MFRLLNKNFGLFILMISALVLIVPYSNIVVYAETSTVNEANQSGAEANLKYLFAVFFLVWAFFFGYTFFLSRRLKEMKNEVAILKKIISERE